MQVIQFYLLWKTNRLLVINEWSWEAQKVELISLASGKLVRFFKMKNMSEIERKETDSLTKEIDNNSC